MIKSGYPAFFFQQGDITDPGLYEEDTRVTEDAECLICGRGFHRNEPVIELKHYAAGHDRFLVHHDCIRFKPDGFDESEILGVLDLLGFAWEEKEECD